MSLILQLLARYWYVPIAMAVAGAGVHIMDSASYDHLETSFASYRAQVAEANGKAQQAAREALQGQIDRRLAAEARNEKITHDLNDTQTRADAAERDRNFAQRLLQAARTPLPTGARVPTPHGQPGTAAAAPDAGDRRLADLLGPAAGECRDAIARYQMLQAQIKPQL